jgi:hypothetical protein
MYHHIIAVDVDALDAQVRERREREQFEAERNQQYDSMTQRHALQIGEAVNASQLDSQRKDEELAYFHREQAREKGRRDAASAARAVGRLDDGQAPQDDAATVFLKFAGEDMTKRARERMQQHQQQDWLTAQQRTRESQERDRAENEAMHAATAARARDLADGAQADANAKRRAAALECAAYNRQLAARNEAASRTRAAHSAAAAEREVDAVMQSQFFNEDAATTTSALAPTISQPTRRVPYHFKGFSTHEKQGIIDMQRQQQLQNRAKADYERQEEMDYARRAEDVRREVLKQQRAQEGVAAENRRTLQVEQRAQAREQTVRRAYIDQNVYVNPVHPTYFDQFGTSAR